MKIKMVATGSTRWERFIRRWGVSFLIGEEVLFDTFGDSHVLLKNMKKYGVEREKIKHIILSHDDWDHISGLWYLLPGRKDITVTVCPGFKQEIKDRIFSFGAKLIEAKEAACVTGDIYTTGELCGQSKGQKKYEQSVVIKTNHGLVLLCGCAHPVVSQIAKHAMGVFKDRIDLLIGGFHLKDNLDKDNLKIIQDLEALGICGIAPTHCTGKRATKKISKIFGRRFLPIKEGDCIEL